MYTSYLYATILCLLLSCQTKKKEVKNESQKFSSENPVKRSVIDNVLISEELPKIEIKVNEEFNYIGKFDFEITANSEEYSEEMRGKPVAAGDRFVFASSDENNSIEKLFIVQLEGFLPSNDLVYNYNMSQAELIGKNKYRHNTWFYDSAKAAQENPKNEGAKTRAFLTEKGFKLQDQYMMSRFVGLASEDRKYEIIIYYHEMLNQTTGYTLDEYENSISKDEAKSIRDSFIERSRESFTIIKG